MTNFERYKETLKEQAFIDSMLLNCDGCPVPYNECIHYGKVTDGVECGDVLQEWCEKEVTE